MWLLLMKMDTRVGVCLEGRAILVMQCQDPASTANLMRQLPYSHDNKSGAEFYLKKNRLHCQSRIVRLKMTITSQTGATVAARVPAWKKIGLKLKNASDNGLQTAENAAAQSNSRTGTNQTNSSSVMNTSAEGGTPTKTANLTIRQSPISSQKSPDKKSKRKRSSEVEADLEVKTQLSSSDLVAGHHSAKQGESRAISTSEIETSSTNTEAITK